MSKNRDYGFLKFNHQNVHVVHAIQKPHKEPVKEERYFNSLYYAGKCLNINPGSVQLCCDGECKYAYSKDAGKKRWRFEYVDPEKLGDGIHIEKKERVTADKNKYARERYHRIKQAKAAAALNAQPDQPDEPQNKPDDD